MEHVFARASARSPLLVARNRLGNTINSFSEHREEPDNLRCLTAPARVVAALRASCFNQLTRHLGPEHKRDKHM